MLKLKSKWFALLGAVALLPAGTAFAQDSGPLIDLLIKKGIVTDQEAETLRADLAKDFAGSSAGKLSLSPNLTEFKISGDARVRYESRTGSLVGDDHNERDRFRYRFRMAFNGKVVNDFFFGTRLETATGSRSSNVTMADEATGGPSSKTSDTVQIGQLYMGWAPSPYFTFTAGRMPNPLVSTSMVWDADINPEGLAEAFKYRTGKTEWSATLAQFLYSTSGNQNPYGGTANVHDLYMFAWQTGLKLYTGENPAEFFQVNPTLYNYVRNDQKNVAAYRGAFTATNTASVDNLFVLDIPVEYDMLVGGVLFRPFADFAINLNGKERVAKWSATPPKNDNKAYMVGLQYGKAANKGEWDAKVFYQSVGAFALDPNLVDSDLFDSRTNMKGLVFNANYALGAATQLTLTLARGSRVNSAIIAPGSGDVGTNNALDKFSLLQFDFNIKY